MAASEGGCGKYWSSNGYDMVKVYTTILYKVVV